MAKLKYWVWLSFLTSVRPWAKVKLAEALGGPDGVFFAEREDLEASGVHLRPAELAALSDKSMEQTARAMAWCEENGADILTVQDAAYPERLRRIADPPAALYVRGKLPPVDESLLLAVVGTRHATPYGLKMAANMGRDIAKGGGVVVSGLAAGCDGAAMEGALRAGGVTVGVLGLGIDKVYPRENAALFEAVRAEGALVSEYPPGARTFPGSFVARNRIITGLSLGVVVTEAPRRSGTRTTADHALEQGRDVFAVPGPADAYTSAGCNELLAQGAVPVTSGADVLRAYGDRSDLLRREPTDIHIKKGIDKPRDIVYIDPTDSRSAAPATPVPAQLPDPPEDLPEDQRKVLGVMTSPDMHADDIITASGLNAPAALAALTMLQIGGWVVQGAGKRYTRKK